MRTMWSSDMDAHFPPGFADANMIVIQVDVDQTEVHVRGLTPEPFGGTSSYRVLAFHPSLVEGIAGIVTLERPCVSLCPWDTRARLLPDLVDHVEFVARQVVADPVARILGEPVFSSARIDVAADRVAHPERPGLGVAGEDRRARRVRASSPLSL